MSSFGMRPFVTRNFEEMLTKAASDDIILAKMSKLKYGSSLEYVCWPGVKGDALFSYLMSLPKEQRAYHAVCGRPGMPLDFFADLDIKLNPAISGNASKAKGILEGVCDEASNVLKSSFGKEFKKLIALESYSETKFSYHVHARVDENVAFRDISALKKFAIVVEQGVRARNTMMDIMDINVYRPGGQLRLYKCVKTVKDTACLEGVALVRPTTWRWTDAEAFSMSLICRDPKSITSFLGSQKATSDSAPKKAAYTRGYTYASARSYVTQAVEKFPTRVSDNYTTWLQVTLALRNLYHAAEVHGHNREEWTDLFQSFSRMSSKHDPTKDMKRWNNIKSKGDQDQIIPLAVNLIRKVERELGQSK